MNIRTLGFRLAAVMLGLLVGGGLTELGLRITGTLPDISKRMVYTPQGPFSRVPHPPFLAYKKDYRGEQVYFTCPQNKCEKEVGIPFETNSMRMRDFSHNLDKPPNTFRILILGDSFSVADGVHRMEAWPHLLGAAVDEVTAVKRVEIINTSMQAYSTLDQWHVLQHVIRYQPDLIMVGIYLNDAMPTTFNWSERGIPEADLDSYWERLSNRTGENGAWLPPLTAQERSLLSYSGLAQAHFLGNVRVRKPSTRPLAVLKWADALLLGRTQRRETVAAIRDWWGPSNELGQLEFSWALQQIGRLSQERDIPVIAVLFPWMDGLTGDYPFQAIHQDILSTLTDAQIPHVDMLSAFQEAAARDAQLWAHPTDHHPSPALHRLTSQALLPIVSDRLDQAD